MKCVSFCTEMTRIFLSIQQKQCSDKEWCEKERKTRISKELAIQCASIFVSWLLSAIKRYKTYLHTLKKKNEDDNDDEYAQFQRWCSQNMSYVGVKIISYSLCAQTHTLTLYIIKKSGEATKRKNIEEQKSSRKKGTNQRTRQCRAIYRSFLCLMANVWASSCVRQVYCLFFMRKIHKYILNIRMRRKDWMSEWMSECAIFLDEMMLYGKKRIIKPT